MAKWTISCEMFKTFQPINLDLTEQITLSGKTGVLFYFAYNGKVEWQFESEMQRNEAFLHLLTMIDNK